MDIFKTWLVEKYVAHRGLHDDQSAENSLSAFEKAIEKGYVIELDVQQISDGTVVVFHDSSLSRMTGQDGYVRYLTKEDLKSCFLGGTKETIPTFEETLKLINGRTPVIVEIKNNSKPGKLESKVLEMLRKYKGEFAIMAFNPYILKWFKDNAPEILRGQLSSFFKNEKLSFLKKFILKKLMLNSVAQPNFIAYNAQNLPNRFVRKYNTLPLLAWTIRSQEEYMRVVKYCDNIIFENFIPKI
ncbi:MAG: glycerophosphodiester phosphodiesterase [Firmicutes bacterium]|nr:glycerophosphodiester phosphodiesterase [Bacillota bacterium]MDY3658648.1 glycerophosphodiester phosphodiesterase [Eubacteriales bacterium]